MRRPDRKILAGALAVLAAACLIAALALLLPREEPAPPAGTPAPAPSLAPTPEPEPVPTPSETPEETGDELPTGVWAITEERQAYVEDSLTLYIPCIDITRAVHDGTDEATLNRGVGLYEYAQLPGEGNRNVSMAGHRIAKLPGAAARVCHAAEKLGALGRAARLRAAGEIQLCARVHQKPVVLPSGKHAVDARGVLRYGFIAHALAHLARHVAYHVLPVGASAFIHVGRAVGVIYAQKAVHVQNAAPRPCGDGKTRHLSTTRLSRPIRPLPRRPPPAQARRGPPQTRCGR